MQAKSNWSFTLILIGLIFIINLFARDLFIRFDLTENQRYSISDVTKEILSEIEDPVTVKIYYSENFPRQLISVKQYVLDMLNEYRAYAGSSLEYEFIPLSGEEDDLEQEAISYGVQPVQANITESDEIKVQRIYLGIVFLYGDQRETIPFAQRIDQLEYDMTGAIRKLIAGSPPKVGWLTGHGEPALFGDQDVDLALSEIRKNYELVEVDLTTEDRVPDDLTVLLMVGSIDPLDDAELYKLDQFIMRGGHIGAFLNTKTIDMTNQFMPVQDNRSNVFDFLGHYGFEFGNQLLLDDLNFQVQAMQNLGIIQIPVAVPYPFAPRITDLDMENPVVNRLSEVGFFFANEIKPGTDTTVSFQSLLRTSQKTGYATPDPRTRMLNISASQQFPEYLFREGSKTVAAIIEGEYQSYFGAIRPDSIFYEGDHLNRSLLPATFVAAGNSTFTSGQFMIPATLTFFLNTIDWLYDENGLISIRSKEIAPSQLDELQAGTRQLLKWINILLAPFVIVLAGVVRWSIRRRAKSLAGGR